MDLSTYLIIATVATFMVGATFAFVWSVTSGQWTNLESQAFLVFDAEDDPRLTEEVSG